MKRSLKPLLYALLFAVVFFYVWSRYHTVQLGYELSRVMARENLLSEEQKALKIEINNLSTFERIEKISHTKLKMQEAQPEQIIFLEPGADVAKKEK